jgi:superfamily II RNA helicase
MLSRKQMLLTSSYFFKFAQCEFLARSIEEKMVDGKQGSEIERIFLFYTQPHKASLEQLPQYHTLREMLQKGIAYHHSGLVPILKEVRANRPSTEISYL